VWSIGGDDNFVGQLLVILKVKKKKTEKKKGEKYSVRWNADEQECEKSTGNGVKN